MTDTPRAYIEPILRPADSRDALPPADMRVQAHTVADAWEAQTWELFEISHPDTRHALDVEARRSAFLRDRRAADPGTWVFFPWSGTLVRCIAEEAYALLRRNRNRELITEEEASLLAKATVGIAGLSVGSNIARALVSGSITRSLVLAERDTLSTTNLNRLHARVDQIGMHKADILMQALWETDPYVRITAFTEGVTEKNLDTFMAALTPPALLVEEIDDFVMKVRLRQAARARGIPVVSVASIGDTILIDVERYDRDAGLALFNGRAGSAPEDILMHPDLTDEDKHRYAVQLVGPEHIPPRALASVRAIGQTLVGRPQLMGTVTVASGLAAHIVRDILLGHATWSGRRVISLDAFIGNAPHTP